MENGKTCHCPHHKMMSVFVVLFGLLFLLHAFGYFSARFVEVGWPTLVVLAGLFKMFSGGCKCCEK